MRSTNANYQKRAGVDSLTAFEYRILELRTRGLSRCEIAQLLRRSPQTISNSMTVAKEKLAAQSLIEAACLVFNAEALRLKGGDSDARVAQEVDRERAAVIAR